MTSTNAPRRNNARRSIDRPRAEAEIDSTNTHVSRYLGSIAAAVADGRVARAKCGSTPAISIAIGDSSQVRAIAR